MSEWIKTDEELPNDKELILFFTEEKVRIGVFTNERSNFENDMSFEEINLDYGGKCNLFNKEDVKFWQRMPLPPAPTDG